MSVGGGLRKILIQTQPAADRPRDARDLQRVCHAGAVMIALRREKDLRFVHEPAEGFAVEDAVGVTLIAGAHLVGLLGVEPPLRFGGSLRQRRQDPIFFLLDALPNGHASALPFL